MGACSWCLRQRQATGLGTGTAKKGAKKGENVALGIMWASALMNGEIRLGLGEVKTLDKRN